VDLELVASSGSNSPDATSPMAWHQVADALCQAATLSNSGQDPKVALCGILEQLCRVIPYDRAAIAILEKQEWQIAADCRFPPRSESSLTEPPPGEQTSTSEAAFDLLDPMALDLVRRKRETLMIPDLATGNVLCQPAPATKHRGEEILRDLGARLRPATWSRTGAWLGTPLSARGQVRGVLSLIRQQPGSFAPQDAQLAMVFAGQAALVVENARLFAAERASRPKSYKDLEQAYDELRQLDKMKSELIQNISHELRTPLTFIKGYIELLQDGEMGDLKPEQQAALTIVATKAEGLSRLVDDIISLQRAGQEQMQFAPHSLAALGRLAVQGAQASAQEAGIALVSDIERVPWVMGDWRRLGQVFDNLIQNAIKFSNAGGQVMVRVRPEERMSAGAGTWVRAEVQDWGIGIAKEQHARIWERFYQVDGTTTRRFGGTGLGLAIVKQIIEAHRGFVGVESELQKGSLFYFAIPAIGANLEQGG